MNNPKKLAAAALLAGGIGWAITGTANAAPYNPPAEPPDPCAAACHVEPASAASSTDPLAGAAVPVTSPDDGPFDTLFGDSGINTWTPAADAYLDTNDPTLAAHFEASVDGFQQGGSFLFPNDPFTFVTDELDPSAFSGGFPDNAIGDFAVGLDYSVDAVGLYPTIDPFLDVLFGVGV